MKVKELFQNLFNRFITSGTFGSANPAGSGHIHKTYLIHTPESGNPDYILQRINQHVFPDIDLLMNNTCMVINHLLKKKQDNYGLLIPELIQTREERNYFRDESGNCWRMFQFIPGQSVDRVNNSTVAFEAGGAFGSFIFNLHDFPAEHIRPVIPDFHSLSKRFADFEIAFKNDPVKRACHVTQEINYMLGWFNPMMAFHLKELRGDFLLLITHNDTKINNILFDTQGKAIAVIDLDTVMPGTVLNDFGDAIRTAAASAPEDERDLSKMKLDINIFRAFAEGFIQKTYRIMKPAEIDHLIISCQYITYMQAMRFLTDYLNGDKYYSIYSADHNLVRTRAQIKLAESMKESQEAMQEIVQAIYHACHSA